MREAYISPFMLSQSRMWQLRTIFVILNFWSISAFVFPSISPSSSSVQKKYSAGILQNSDNEDEYTLTIGGKSAQAGKDGYSLLRQPLLRESWDPSMDPKFAAPKTLNEEDSQKQNMDWWSNRKSSTSSFYKTTTTTTYSSGGLANRNGASYSTVPANGNEESDDMESLDLFQRSLDTLDFPFVLKALRNECFTAPGQQLVDEARYAPENSSDKKKKKTKKKTLTGLAYRPLTAENPEGVEERYDAVEEMQWLLDGTTDLGGAYYKNRLGYQVTLGNGNPPPLEGLRFDLKSILESIKDGEILEGPELLDVSSMMNAMEDLQLWSMGLQRVETREFIQLPMIIEEIELNTTLQTLLEEAFDEDGKLSGITFPLLGRLRERIRSLKADILRTLDSLVSMPSIKSKLALESGGPLYSEISNGGGRLVLPMDPKYASQFGIVHDSSRSGKTVYVEPSEVIGPTNELRQAEGELRVAEARVWRSLTEQVWNNREDLERAVMAVGQLDLVLARCLLGRKLLGVIPTVKDEGVISLQNAKHPVLLLRGIKNVVGSDVDIGADGNQGLILTGPNAGGKTVILKLLGLMALMARSGIPVPANYAKGDYKPRVDYFDPVLADIGDIQSVGGDLSTFSGHMLVCKEVLANAKKNALVLMDELGSGTDPAQGVAIAQALLEAMLETGTRVVITTHYMGLKQLAASDPRFSVAGMQFVQGRPTYKLLPGTVGESFAIAVAERLELPDKIISRAYELLDSDTRQMGDLLREMEDQKALIDEQLAEIEEKKKEMAAMELKMKEENIKLEKKMLTARRDEAKKFAKKLEEKEQVLEEILEKLKSDPSRKVLAKSWDDIKFVKRDALNEAENVPSVLRKKRKEAKELMNLQEELVPLAEMREKPEINIGDKLVVCKQGVLFGKEAEVIKVLGRQIQVKVPPGLVTTLKMTDLSWVEPGTVIPQMPKKPSMQTKKSRLSRAAEKALQEEGNSRVSTSTTSDTQSTGGSGTSIRTDSNTVDVRGQTLDGAKELVREKISQCIMTGRPVIYVLHGHGTGGVLKAKIRGWLKSERGLVKNWAPAEMADGGDAFTRLVLR